MRSAIRWFKCKLKPPKNTIIWMWEGAVFPGVCLSTSIGWYPSSRFFPRSLVPCPFSGVPHLHPIILSLVPCLFLGGGSTPVTGPRSLPRGGTSVTGPRSLSRGVPQSQMGILQAHTGGTQSQMGVPQSQMEGTLGWGTPPWPGWGTPLG